MKVNNNGTRMSVYENGVWESRAYKGNIIGDKPHHGSI